VDLGVLGHELAPDIAGVLGDTAAWTQVEPYVLSLLPGAEGTAEIRFRPPRSSEISARAIPFGLRAASREDPDGSTVEEGTVEVTPFIDTSAEVIPRTARGRVAANYDLAFDNRGNTKINAEMTAVDPNNALTFEFEPAGLVADPNTAAFARVKAKPRKRFLRGPARTHTFQVTVAPTGTPPLTTDATLLQEGLIPKWVPKAHRQPRGPAGRLGHPAGQPGQLPRPRLPLRVGRGLQGGGRAGLRRPVRQSQPRAQLHSGRLLQRLPPGVLIRRPGRSWRLPRRP
jgi:hypothetical protein